MTSESIVPSFVNLNNCITRNVSEVHGCPASRFEYLQYSISSIHQVVFKIYDRITGPWNVGHWPTYI